MAKPFSKDKKDKDKVSLFPRKDIVKLGIYVKKKCGIWDFLGFLNFPLPKDRTRAPRRFAVFSMRSIL
jgi:hypothetical protein